MRQGIADFTHKEVSGSLVLLVATITALILANSPPTENYAQFWKTEVDFRIGPFEFYETLIHWINDFLMAFSFIVLIIKREQLKT